MNKPNRLALIRERFLVWLFFRSKLTGYFIRNFKYCQISEWIDNLSNKDFLYIINFEYISDYEDPLYDDPKYDKLFYLLPKNISDFVIIDNGLIKLKKFIIYKIYKNNKFKRIIKENAFSKIFINKKIEKFLNFLYEDYK